MAENQDWLRGVAVLPADVDEQTVARLDALGTRGTRINRSFANGPSDREIENIIQKVKPFSWHVQLFAPLVQEAGLLKRIADQDVVVVVDHLGHTSSSELLASHEFATLTELMRQGQAWVKLSAPYRSSEQMPDYADLRPLVDALLKANPDRLVWGTDWPHPHITSMPNDGDLVDLLFDWLPDESLRQKVLVDNPTQLYWDA